MDSKKNSFKVSNVITVLYVINLVVEFVDSYINNCFSGLYYYSAFRNTSSRYIHRFVILYKHYNLKTSRGGLKTDCSSNRHCKKCFGNNILEAKTCTCNTLDIREKNLTS